MGVTSTQSPARKKQDPAYAKRWRLDHARGIRRYVNPDPTITHVHHLIASGAKAPWIAAAAHVGRSVACRIAVGDAPARLQARTAAALNAVTFQDALAAAPAGALVPATGTHRRINSLHVMGHRHVDINAEIRRQGGAALSGLLIQRRWVTRENARLVAAVYDVLWDVQGPSSLASRRALAAGSVPPMCWDDDTIDDPTAHPSSGLADRTDMDEVLFMVRSGRTVTEAAAAYGLDPDSVVTAVRRHASRTGDGRLHRIILAAREDEREALRARQKQWAS